MKRLVLVATLALNGCAHWANNDPNADLSHDQQVCQYQADLGTPAGETDSMGQAVASGIFDGIREANLINECMSIHGWYKERDN